MKVNFEITINCGAKLDSPAVCKVMGERVVVSKRPYLKQIRSD